MCFLPMGPGDFTASPLNLITPVLTATGSRLFSSMGILVLMLTNLHPSYYQQCCLQETQHYLKTGLFVCSEWFLRSLSPLRAVTSLIFNSSDSIGGEGEKCEVTLNSVANIVYIKKYHVVTLVIVSNFSWSAMVSTVGIG